MTAQLQLNLLEWIDAGDAVLRNVGTFGPAYDHSKVERFQKATNAVAGVLANGPTNPAIPSVRVDGYWGAEVVSSLKVLLKRAPVSPFPAVFPNVYRYEQWNNASVQTYIVTTLATRRQEVQAAIAAQAAPPMPDATSDASREAQAARDAATDPLTAPPTPEAPPVAPPPDVAPPGPQPPGPSGGTRSPGGGESAPFYVLGNRERKQANDVPWFAIGLGVLVFAGVIGWATYRKRRGGRA